MISLVLAALLARPRTYFGYHLAEVALKGDWLKQAPQILKAADAKITKTRVLKSKALETVLHGTESVIIAYVDQGWTHFFDPEYATALVPEPWIKFSKTHRTRAISWCCEDTTNAFFFGVYDHGQTLRSVNVVDGKVENHGKPLPQERKLNWSNVAAEDVLDLIKRLGAPCRLDNWKGRATVFNIVP